MPVATKEATGIDSRDEGGPLPLNLNPQPISKREHFEFEMLCISNHTACRFAEKARFFRSVRAGRRCTARKRKNISAPQKERCPAVSIIMTCRRGTAIRALSRAFPFPVILLNKARWGRGGGRGRAQPFHSAARKGVLVVLSREQRPKAAAGRARCDEGSYGHRQQR